MIYIPNANNNVINPGGKNNNIYMLARLVGAYRFRLFGAIIIFLWF